MDFLKMIQDETLTNAFNDLVEFNKLCTNGESKDRCIKAIEKIETEMLRRRNLKGVSRG